MGMITENEYVAARNKLMDKYLVIRDLENQVALLFSKLNAASSVRLKQVFQSVIQWYEAHSFGHFRQAILCGKTIMQIILHDGF